MLPLAALALCAALSGGGEPGSGKIKHVIILMEENRSFDHMFGWFNRVRGGKAKVNGLTGTESNEVTTKDGKKVRVTVDDKAPQIRYPLCDPDHSTSATTKKIFPSGANATMGGFAQIEYNEGKEDSEYCGVMSMFKPEQVPILTQLAQEYALFDEFFCSHPGPTWPNRMYALSATTLGATETGTWYKNKRGSLFPQKTIMDQVAEAGLTWRNYFNDTPWELFLESIAHNPDNTRSLDAFFADAAEGTLPSYAWINPRSGINVTTGVGANDQHPDHDVAAGEALYKAIYEALRASPQWNETLFVITYDEHGGFYDHVVPPSAPPPAEGMTSYPDEGFAFDRLGVRIPTLLISPWVQKGAVIPPPASAAYDLTTLVATTRKLLNIPDEPLTARDAWVATFEGAVAGRAEPRGDCPLHLVDPVPPARPEEQARREAGMGLNGLQRHIGATLSHAAGRRGYDDTRAFGLSENVTRQGQVSEHLQMLHRRHVAQMAQRRRAHAAELAANAVAYEVVVSPNGGLAAQFIVAKAPGAGGGGVAAALQIQTAAPVAGVRLCLDVGADPVRVAEGQPVGVAACSSELPAGRSQRWAESGGTLRPYYAQSFCLTANCPRGECGAKGHVAVFRKCAAGSLEVSQHWSYDGPAPGADPRRYLFFGYLTNALAIVAK